MLNHARRDTGRGVEGAQVDTICHDLAPEGTQLATIEGTGVGGGGGEGGQRGQKGMPQSPDSDGLLR